MEKTAKIYIAGHKGMVGSGIERKLRKEGFTNIVTRTSNELDLRNQQSVNDFFKKEKPSYVILAAAKVGGIHANNTYKAEFIYDNLMIEANVIHASYLHQVTKLLFLGSSCIYPKMAPQPLKEEYLLSGYLEPTNQPYSIAKIAGIELCDSYRSQYGCNFISAMPTNLYGTNDNYHPENSHVIPALIRKIIFAKYNNDSFVTIWGSGSQRREFMHVDDLADACYYLLDNYNESGFINVGTGEDISILELAEFICKEVGFEGELIPDKSKPEGPSKKILNTQKLTSMGWSSKINIKFGLKSTIFEAKEVLHKN
jgi:GDP-L-fucose synthase